MWIKKREFAVYMVLRSVFGDDPFNIGDAVEVLECFMTRKTAVRVVRRLSKLGWLERVDTLTYRISCLDTIYREKILPYIALRVRRMLRSRGVEFTSIKVEDGRIVVEVDERPAVCAGEYASKIVSFRVV